MSIWSHPKLFNLTFSAITFCVFSVDIEPVVHVNPSVWTPPAFAVCQLLAVRPPQHQHGLPSSHNTPSVCSPVVPVRRVLPSPSGACLWSLTTRVPVRLSPDFFQFRNVVPACYRSTKSLVFVHIRQEQILSLLSESTFVSTLALYPRGRRSAQQGCAAAAQSAVTPSCKQTRSRYSTKLPSERFSVFLSVIP